MGDWVGPVWVDMDPVTGAGGYMIAGQIPPTAGGGTVDWDDVIKIDGFIINSYALDRDYVNARCELGEDFGVKTTATLHETVGDWVINLGLDWLEIIVYFREPAEPWVVLKGEKVRLLYLVRFEKYCESDTAQRRTIGETWDLWQFKVDTALLPTGTTGFTTLKTEVRDDVPGRFPLAQCPSPVGCGSCSLEEPRMCDSVIYTHETQTLHLVDVVVKEEESRLALAPSADNAEAREAVVEYDVIADDVGKAAIEELSVEIRRGSTGEVVFTDAPLSLASRYTWKGEGLLLTPEEFQDVFDATLKLIIVSPRGTILSEGRPDLLTNPKTKLIIYDMQLDVEKTGEIDLQEFNLGDNPFEVGDKPRSGLGPEAFETDRKQPTQTNEIKLTSSRDGHLFILVRNPSPTATTDNLVSEQCLGRSECKKDYPLKITNPSTHNVVGSVLMVPGNIEARKEDSFSVNRGPFVVFKMMEHSEIGEGAAKALRDAAAEKGCAEASKGFCAFLAGALPGWTKVIGAICFLLSDIFNSVCELGIEKIVEIEVGAGYEYRFTWRDNDGYCADLERASIGLTIGGISFPTATEAEGEDLRCP